MFAVCNAGRHLGGTALVALAVFSLACGGTSDSRSDREAEVSSQRPPSAPSQSTTAVPGPIGEWALDSLLLDGEPYLPKSPGLEDGSVLDGVAIRFDATGSFDGMALCNGFRGRYDVSGGSIELTDITAQAVHCLDADDGNSIMDAEDKFLALLGARDLQIAFEGPHNDIMKLGSQSMFAVFRQVPTS